MSSAEAAQNIRRVVLVAALTTVVLALRMVPTPPPAQASICSVPLIGTVCTIVSGTAGGIKWTLNYADGSIKAFGHSVGTIVKTGTGFACNWLAEGWMQKTICPLAKRAAGAAAGAAANRSTSANGPPGSANSNGQPQSNDQNTPQANLSTAGMAAASALFMGSVAHLIGQATSVDLRAGWFHGLYARVAAYAIAVMGVFLLIAIAQSLIRHREAMLSAALLAVPGSAITIAAATTFIGLGIVASDQAAAAITGPNMHAATHVLHIMAGAFLALGLLAKGASHAGHSTWAAVLGTPAWLFAGLSMAASFVLLLELALRAIGIYAAVLFVPLVMAARVWPRLEHAPRQLGQVIAALVASKFVLVVMLAAGAAGVLSLTFLGMVAGVGMIAITVVCPVVFYRLFGGLVDHHFHRATIAPGATIVGGPQQMMAQMHARSEQSAQAHTPQPPPPTPGPAAAQPAEQPVPAPAPPLPPPPRSALDDEEEKP